MAESDGIKLEYLPPIKFFVEELRIVPCGFIRTVRVTREELGREFPDKDTEKKSAQDQAFDGLTKAQDADVQAD